jgi:hypothetical protein
MGLGLSLLQGLAVALGIVSLKHLKIVLDGLQEYGTMLTNPETSILTLMKVPAFPPLWPPLSPRPWDSPTNPPVLV